MPLGLSFKANDLESNARIIENKLVGWKKIYLSKGRRLTLLKSALSNTNLFSITVYYSKYVEIDWRSCSGILYAEE